MNKNIRKPTGLRKWVRARIPKWEYFLFDVPWSRRNVGWIIVLLTLLALICLLPVEFLAKWLHRK